MKKLFTVTTKHERYIAQAKMLERMINSPSMGESIWSEIERRIHIYFSALAEGKSVEEANRLALQHLGDVNA
jgi:hypothetical protein